MINVLKKIDTKDEMPILKNQEIRFEVTKSGRKSKQISRFYLLRIRTSLEKFTEEEKDLSS